MYTNRCAVSCLVLAVFATRARAIGVEDEPARTAGAGSTLNYPALYDCLEGPGAPIAAACASSNFHPDTHIDLYDFAVLQRSYLTLAPSPIQLGTETAGEVAPAEDVDEFSFSASFGSTVTVDFATPLVNARPDLMARIDLVRPNGSIASTNATCAANIRLDSIPIDITGTWRARVRVYESWMNCGYGADDALRTGIYTLTVCLSNQPPIAIVYGQTRRAAFSSDCQIVNFTFAGLTGDVATALYLGPAYLRNMRLYAPNGVLLATSGGGSGTALTDAVLPVDGTYRIAVEAQDGQSAAGGFSVGLSALHDALAIANSVPIQDALSKPAEAQLYSFETTFGSKVTVDFNTPPVAGRPDLIARVDLVRPDGTTASTNATCAANVRLDSVFVNFTGTWTVRVRTYESWFNCGMGAGSELTVGNYGLSVCTSEAPPTAITYGQVRAGSFISDCQIVNYSFAGQTGDLVSILYNGPAVARYVQLYSPDDVLLASSSGGAGTGLVDVLLPFDGVHRIAVEAADTSPPGAFSIGLNELGGCVPIESGVSVAGELVAVPQADQFCFEALAGTTVNVDFNTPLVMSRPDVMARVDLVRPNGTIASTNATCAQNVRLDAVPINISGTWAVRVRPYESWFNCGHGNNPEIIQGTYTLTVCASDHPATPISYGQSIAGTFVTDCDIVNYEFAGATDDVVTAIYLGPAQTRGMRLFAPDGVLVASSSAGGSSVLGDVHLPTDGVYRVAIEAADSQTPGAFVLGLDELSNATPIPLDTPTAGTLSPYGDMDNFSFEAPFGGVVTVELNTSLVSNRPDLLASLDLIRPDGVRASSNATCATSVRLDNVVLTRGGTWTARPRAYESWFNCGYGADPVVAQGDFNLTVCASFGPSTAIAYGQALAGFFGVDCEFDNYVFTGSLGDVVTAMFLGPGSTRRLQLYAPNGTLLSTTSGGLCPQLYDVVLPTDGAYRLVAEAADGLPIGEYSIALNRLAAASPISINTPRAASIAQAAEVDVYSFTGNSGSSVTVDFVTPSVLGRPDVLIELDLLRPDGTLHTYAPSCGPTARIQNSVLTATGVWTLRARVYPSWCSCGFGADQALLTGAYTVTVCDSSTCP